MSSRPQPSPLSIQLVPSDQLAELRRAASDYVLRATSCALDGSEESLAYVDHYLERLRQDPPRRPEALRLVAFALGTYLGDLAIARLGSLAGAAARARRESEGNRRADPMLGRCAGASIWMPRRCASIPSAWR